MLRPTCIFLGLVTTTLAAMEAFIVGGKFANIEYHAHSAFLSAKCVTDTGKRASWICGSSVVNQNILLTAAHCLYQCNYNSHIGISVGNEHRHRGQAYSTYSFVIHEDYDPRTTSNDIGLIRVISPIFLSKKVSRVALMKQPPYYERATVAGWGMVDDIREEQSDWLKFLTQKVRNRSDCLALFKHAYKGTICAASDSPNDYPSHGDSGSALIVRGYIQIGLVSHKIPSVSKYIIIYTDVGYFYDWIRFYAKYLVCL